MRKLNHNTMKKILLITLIFSCLGCFAQVETEYEKYVREQNEQMKSMQQSDQEAMKKLQKEYEDYVKAEKEAYDKFVKEREVVWGKGNVKESTQKDWVEYSDNGNTRSVVDFEKGEATIEIIQEPNQKVDNKEIEKKRREFGLPTE